MTALREDLARRTEELERVKEELERVKEELKRYTILEENRVRVRVRGRIFSLTTNYLYL